MGVDEKLEEYELLTWKKKPRNLKAAERQFTPSILNLVAAQFIL